MGGPIEEREPLEPWWTPEALKELREVLYQESQRRFAARLRMSLNTYRWWEQGRNQKPWSGPEQLLFDRLREDYLRGEVRPHPDDPKPARKRAGKS